MGGIFSAGGIIEMGVVYKKSTELRKEFYHEHPEFDQDKICFLGKPLRPFFKTEEDYQKFLERVRFGKPQDKLFKNLTAIERLKNAGRQIRSKQPK